MAPKASLRSLSKAYIRAIDQEHQQEVLGGSDRAAALVACAVLDIALVNVLCTQFIDRGDGGKNELFYSQDAALPSMSSRIRIGLALAVFDEDFAKHLTTIKNIRNAFAHSGTPLTFENELVKAKCLELPEITFKVRPEKEMNPERERYLAMCQVMAIMLDEVSDYCSGKDMHKWISDGEVTLDTSLQKQTEQSSDDHQTQNETLQSGSPQLQPFGAVQETGG